jgi:hypothetical protein
MRRQKILLLLAAMTILFSARTHAQDLNNLPPVTGGGDQAEVPEAQVPGEIQIARWDMLLNQAGADAVKKVGTPVDTKSELYQGMTCNGFEIRQAVADAMTNGGVEQAGRNLTYGQSFNGNDNLNIPQGLNLTYYNNPARNGLRMSAFFQQSNDSFQRHAGDALHVTLNESQFNGQMITGNRPTQIKVPATIQYDGDLSAGQAVAFIAPLTSGTQTYYQLTVWETFHAVPEVMQMFQMERNSGWWCQNGPSKLRKWTGVALIWESQADHLADDVPAAFVKKLDDGKELRLVALSRPSDAPFCWWDGDGKAVSLDQNQGFNNFDGDPPAGLQAIVELRGPSRENQMRTPATQPVDLNNGVNGRMVNGPIMVNGQIMYMNGAMSDVPFNESNITTIPEGSTQVDVGIPVRDWKELAQLNLDEDKVIDGVTYGVHSVPRNVPSQVAARLFQVILQVSAVTDNNLAISPVGPGGKEAFSNAYRPEMFFRRSAVGRPNLSMVQQFQGMALDDVQYFRLCERDRQWITFDHFAAQPQTPVKMDFTSDDLTAAMKNQQQQQQLIQQHAMENTIMQSGNRAQWEGASADPTTPMGAIKTLINAAGTGDEKIVRQMISGPANASDGLDALAHYYTVSQSNWKKAVDKFGRGEVAALCLAGVPLHDLGALLYDVPWTRGDDGGWSAGADNNLRKDSSGHYTLDVSFFVAHPLDKESSDIQDRIAKELDQPNLTIQQFRDSALSPPGP